LRGGDAQKAVTDYFANTDFPRPSFSSIASIAVELTSDEVTDYPFIFGYGSTASRIMVIEAAPGFRDSGILHQIGKAQFS
jgi:hypothetical protein